MFHLSKTGLGYHPSPSTKDRRVGTSLDNVTSTTRDSTLVSCSGRRPRTVVGCPGEPDTGRYPVFSGYKVMGGGVWETSARTWEGDTLLCWSSLYVQPKDHSRWGRGDGVVCTCEGSGHSPLPCDVRGDWIFDLLTRNTHPSHGVLPITSYHFQIQS